MLDLEILQSTNNTDMSIMLRAVNCDVHIKGANKLFNRDDLGWGWSWVVECG